MIIFHEGLPRSGKSYESTVKHILPALKSGRKVFARINGLNHEKFAELAGITLEQCQSLLIHIEESQVTTIHNFVENDSLVVIDELQNFFPSGRVKLTDEMTKFVTEHGHRGLDIVCMGQSLADCHNIWRRRVQRKIQFLKLDALGTTKKYRWTAYQGILDAKGEITFTKISAGTENYDPQFFGTYASHQAETTNKDNLKDSRLNVFNTPVFKFVIPGALVAAGYAIYFLLGFFENPDFVPPEQNKPSVVSSSASPAPDYATRETKPNQPPPKPKDWDFVMELNDKYQAQLTYKSEFNGFIYDALVVWIDDSNRIKDQLYYQDLIELGYTVASKSYGLYVTKGEHKAYYRWMPKYETYGTVPEQTKEQLN